MDGLPEDLLVFIFCRLDRRSLLSAKQACRDWRIAICGPKLMRARAQTGVQGSTFILMVDQATEDPDPPLAETPPLRHPPIRLSFYDASSNRWRQIEPPDRSGRLHPGRRSGFCCACMEGEVYVLGGRCWQWDPLLNSWAWKATPGVFCYSPLSNTWRQVQPMGEPRANFACCVMGGKLYVAGGCARVLDSTGGTLRLMVGGRGWAGFEAEPIGQPEATSVPSPSPCGYDGFGNRFGRRVAASKPEWGGEASAKQVQALDSAEVYDPRTDTWRQIASMPGGVQFPDEDSCAGEDVGGRFVVVGTGFGSEEGMKPKEEEERCEVLSYQPETDTWQVLGCGPGFEYRRGYGSAVVCNHLVVFGGLSKLKPEWGRDGKLMLPKRAPGIYSALDAFVEGGGELDPRLATLSPAAGQVEGGWVRVGEYKAPDAIPKLSPACVSWGRHLYLVGSQERKMGAWEVYGLWRQPQAMWRFDVGEGGGDEQERWRQVARTPYAPVKPKLVKLEF